MTTRRFPWLPYWVALILLFVIAAAPLAVTFYAAGVANSHGCIITEGPVFPCVIDGVDRGKELQALGISFWYALYTWPFAFFAFLVWLVILLIHRSAWRRRQQTAA